MNSEIERECVRRLLLELGKTSFSLESPKPPAPDVRVLWPDGTGEVFEVTEVHPDEIPGLGSQARAEEESRIRRNPSEMATTWLQLEALPAIEHRVKEKVKKASGYELRPGEPLALLLAAALAQPGAAAATFAFPPALTEEMLNQRLHEVLLTSRFERAYIQLQFGHALWEWTRPAAWRNIKLGEYAGDGRSAIEMLKANAGPGGLPPFKVVGR